MLRKITLEHEDGSQEVYECVPMAVLQAPAPAPEPILEAAPEADPEVASAPTE